MANGGIAVSGGTAGHGTLIYTNLLYSPLLFDAYGNPIARPSVTLGGTAGAAGYEAAFVADHDHKTLFKTAASDNDITLTFDLGSGNANIVYGIVLIGHNLTEDNVSDATDSYALALFEGGTTTGYSDVSQALTINASALTPAYHLLASPQAYRYWRVRVNFNASTVLQIGEAFLIGAAPYAFAKNYNWQYNDSLELGQVMQDGGISGVPRVYTRWRRRRMDLTFTDISAAQLAVLQAADCNSHVIFSPTGSTGYAYFGILELEQPKARRANYQNVVAHFTEIAR